MTCYFPENGESQRPIHKIEKYQLHDRISKVEFKSCGIISNFEKQLFESCKNAHFGAKSACSFPKNYISPYFSSKL